MPSVSPKQQHLMSMALALKRGHKLKLKKPQEAMRLAKTMTESSLSDYARKVKL